MNEEAIRVLVQEMIFEYGIPYTVVSMIIIVSLIVFTGWYLKRKFHYDIEKMKTANDKANYISKTQFDIEFQIYQELYQQIYGLAHEMIYSSTEYKCYDKLNKKFKALLSCVKRNAPFINKDMYESFDIFVKVIKDTLKIRLDLEWEENSAKFKGAQTVTEKEVKLEETYVNEVILLNQSLEILTDSLRDYLSSLRVYQ